LVTTNRDKHTYFCARFAAAAKKKYYVTAGYIWQNSLMLSEGIELEIDFCTSSIFASTLDGLIMVISMIVLQTQTKQ